MAFNLTTLLQAAGSGVGAYNEGTLRNLATQREQEESQLMQAFRQAQDNRARESHTANLGLVGARTDALNNPVSKPTKLSNTFEGALTEHFRSDPDKLMELLLQKRSKSSSKSQQPSSAAIREPSDAVRRSFLEKQLRTQMSDVDSKLVGLGVESLSELPEAAQAGLDQTSGGFLGFGVGPGSYPDPDSTIFNLEKQREAIGSPGSRLDTGDSLSVLFPDIFPNQQGGATNIAPSGIPQPTSAVGTPERIQEEVKEFVAAGITELTDEMVQEYLTAGFTEEEIQSIQQSIVGNR